MSNTRIAIARGGTTVFNQAVADPCAQCAVVPAGVTGGGSSLTIRDLDGDGEPEVLFDIYTGGAHCCSYTWIYRFTGSTYAGLAATWGDTGYTLVDLNGDGVPELRSYDDRFAYEFTDFADSAFPPAIFSYRAGRLSDATRSSPRSCGRTPSGSCGSTGAPGATATCAGWWPPTRRTSTCSGSAPRGCGWSASPSSGAT